MNVELGRAIVAWIDPVQCMVRSLGLVVQWFAEDDEEQAFRRTIAYHEAMLETFMQWVRGVVPAGTRPNEELVRFSGFSERTARAVSPLIETVLVHQPEFLPMAQQGGEKEAIAFYGHFHGAWATYLCQPVWRMVPDLAPPGWKTDT